MSFLILVLIGILSGIIGGMGMGGGTILIPLLSIFLNVFQKQIQLLNIFSFVIMSIFILPIHIKNKLVKVFDAIAFSFFGAIFSFISALFITKISNNILKVLFGIFLLSIALIQFIFLIIKKKQKG